MTLTQAIDKANTQALATGLVHSVRRHGKGFTVRVGMIGTLSGASTYTARPETLRWKLSQAVDCPVSTQPYLFPIDTDRE